MAEDPFPKPAALMRRMAQAELFVATLSRNASDPVVRLPVEAQRGRLTVQLAGAGGDSRPAIQWTQNGVPIAGQTGETLVLANLTGDDTDLYFATIGHGPEQVRSQALLLAVTPGNTVPNYSARGRVAPGQPLIAGFFVARGAGHAKARRYLIRVIGTGLKKFGTVETVATPSVTLHRRGVALQDLLRTDDAAALRDVSAKVGAFALEDPAKEFVALAELPPGAYTLTASGSGNESGELLLEIYEA